MGAILHLLERFGRKRVILDRNNKHPYLIRYYLFLKERSWFPVNIFLHKFMKSDPGDLHDHPWSYFTFIVKGGYFEWTPQPDGRVLREWHGRWHFRFKSASSKHRIELMEGVTPWTIFIAFKHEREWGFYPKGKFVHNAKYLEKKGK